VGLIGIFILTLGAAGLYRLQDNGNMNISHPADAPLSPGWQWNPGYAALGSPFLTPVPTQALPHPYLVAYSTAAAQLIGLDAQALHNPHWQQIMSGNATPADCQAAASVYSGHQFGVWAGQLGDGRATLLGEIAPPAEDTGVAHEFQLKGAGLTPFSRMGDGRAVLRSSIREFLCSEAMHALGIPTTRAVCIMGSDAPVYREQIETAAVVTRLAPSFIRFGHFEHFSFRNQHAELKTLADYVITRYYPECLATQQFNGNPYCALLQAVATRTARLMAQWQAVGFCHGVMNTDNMSILGLTIDYGPFQFLDGFDPGHICNHSDTQGRYAFHKQPSVAYWNLFCLGQALLPLIEDPALATAALETYKAEYPQAFDACMAAKLGFGAANAALSSLAQAVLPLLAEEQVDYTIFWRRLSHWAKTCEPGNDSVRDLFVDRSGVDAWLLQYSELLARVPRAQAADLMLKTNPKYVLRNHLGELAIQAARKKDFSPLAQLLAVLECPFEEHPAWESYADFPPDWASSISISCSS
jgi:uncharacterized protein YdiU (UPF0061 family)